MADADIFYGTSGPHNADIAIVGESWGEAEARKHVPFVGYTGDELDKILAECGMVRGSIFFTNVVSERPPDNKMLWFFHATEEARKEGQPLIRGLYPKPNVMRGVELLGQQLSIVKPKIVIGFGNYTLWALTDNSFGVGDDTRRKVPTGMGNWRGSQLYCREDMGGARFLPTYHPAAVFRTWSWRYDIIHDLKARMPKALAAKWDPPDYNFLIRPSFEAVMKTLDYITEKAWSQAVWLAEDIETAWGHITCISLAWSRLDAICIPFTCRGGEAYWSEEEEVAIALALRKLHTNPNIKTVGMNFLYDAQYISLHWGYIPKCEADVMILHHLCWPGKPKSLNYISSLYNNFHSFWKDEGKEWHPTFSDEQHWSYCCRDAVETFEANLCLQGIVDFLGLRVQAHLQMQQYEVNLNMMIRGLRIDLKARRDLSGELALLIIARCEWLEKIIPQSVFPRKPKKSPWYTSPMQQAELFYDVLGVQEVKGKGKRKAKGRTCDDDALTIIGNREPCLRPIIQTIQELRSLRIFKKNFVEAALDPDNKLRCTIDPTGARTFRNSCYENAFRRGANLQTIPKGTEE